MPGSASDLSVNQHHGIDEIEFFDDLVSPALQERLAALVRQPIWQYGWKSDARRNRFCYWHAHFAGGRENFLQSCEDELQHAPRLAPIFELWRTLNSGHLAQHIPIWIYANSHTFGVEGYVHTDTDEEDYFSSIYYAHRKWHSDWAGDTVFYTPERDDILATVYPRPGRVLTFPGRLPHCARSPSRDCTELRISIIVKTIRPC